MPRRPLLIISFFALIAVFSLIGAEYETGAVTVEVARAQESLSAAVYGVVSITSSDLRFAYKHAQPTRRNAEKVHILIVPGHEPTEGGTMFDGVYERDVTVDIANALAAELANNHRFEVTVARTKDAWNPILANYFKDHADDIAAFRLKQTALTDSLVARGMLQIEPNQVYHNTAPDDVSLHLYGINKWASENDVAVTIHIHVNDYPRKLSRAGTYTGFAIYIPDNQYSNASASKEVGTAIAARLKKYEPTSTMPGEIGGVVEDQDLIAIGSNNSADDASLLIEYGYMYEPQFLTAPVRTVAIAHYAHATYLGLQDFFTDSQI